MITLREHIGVAYVLSANMCKQAEPDNECPGCDVAKRLEAALEILDNVAHEDHGLHYTELVALIPDPEWGEQVSKATP